MLVSNLSARDLEGVLSVVAEAAAAAAAEGKTPFDQPVIDRLTQLVPADKAGYYELTPLGRSVFEVEIGGVVDAEAVSRWTERVADHLPSWPLHDGRLRGLPTAAMFSDFVSERVKRRNPWYTEVMRPDSQEHECKLVLPDSTQPRGERNVRGFFFVRERGRKDFDERDRAVLNLLGSQLAAIRDRWELRCRPLGLTARETEIAHLLREGLTNQDIADRLVISTGTVRTHLENVFEKLGVHTRTAAVARAFGHA